MSTEATSLTYTNMELRKKEGGCQLKSMEKGADKTLESKGNAGLTLKMIMRKFTIPEVYHKDHVHSAHKV